MINYDELDWTPNECFRSSDNEKIAKPEINSKSSNQILNIYPNPADDKFHIIVNNKNVNPIEISIFDVSGRNMKKLIINSQDNPIIISDLNKGVYYIKVYYNNEYKTKKLVITR